MSGDLIAKWRERFDELVRQVEFKADGSFQILDSTWARWASSAEHLLGEVFGRESAMARCFKEPPGARGPYGNYRLQFEAFRAAHDEFTRGLYRSLPDSIAGELLGDFVGLAKAALSEGNKDVAAVLSAAAIEDALKRFARSHGLDVEGKELDAVVNALKSKGLVGGAMKTTMETMPKLRNHALHAEWEKLPAPVVGGMVGFVEAFVIEHFSGR